MNRNDPCSCGSGKRYKHCCGSDGATPKPARFEALAAHRAGQLGRAETLYGRALAQNPDDVDSRHMLGVVQLQRMRFREALDLLWDAAERTSWSAEPIRHNLGLVLGKLLTREANDRQAGLLAAFVAWDEARAASRVAMSPLVSVVMFSYHNARHVTQAIASVAAQSYSHIELVIVEDDPVDDTPEVIARAVRGLPFPARVVARANRGTPAALNEAVALAKGKYVAFLNADDYFSPDRITGLVHEIAATDARWGFSLVAPGHAPDDADTAGNPDRLDVQRQRNHFGRYPNSFAFVESNVALSSGNLFVEREFFLALEGFRDFRHHSAWDFCLRATAMAEPVLVSQPLYFHRAHPGDTTSEFSRTLKEDERRVLTEFFAAVLSGTSAGTNIFGPFSPKNRTVLLRLVLGGNHGALVPVEEMRSLAADWRARPPSTSAAVRAVDPPVRVPKTAFVVLGMHRSGTSAMARVLNLCGAALPVNLVTPKLGVNPKGFWEPEAVVDLDSRLMSQLGGDWCHVDFSVPVSGDIVDEFESDAHAMLASEYGDQPRILIKDPRICILAPLWHRTLVGAGYRPVYVVTVRNPLEVAQSLQARGDMTVEEGLQLWLAHMRHVMAFSEKCPDVVYVRFTTLLDDWRQAVGEIANRTGVTLDAGDSAQEVDAFLDQDLRRQAVSDESLDSALPYASMPEVHALYQLCLSRCAGSTSRSQTAQNAYVELSEDRLHSLDPAVPTATFLLCIEGNAIREQALLLCESIRRFAGRYRRAPILAFAPRPGLGVDASTRRLLNDLDVEYIDEPLNILCPEYGSANRVFSGAFAERHANTDFIVVLDSDTVWLDEPHIPGDADVAIRPVDTKGSATRGPGDLFDDYWVRLAEMGGVSLDRLPAMRTTVGNELIRASYNGGLTVVRRNKGILTRCADLFAASVRAGMRPYRGCGVNIIASTGEVGLAGSEYWGSNQAAMTLAIWATTDRVLTYPDSYNVPLHLIADAGEIDPRWLQHPPVHLHYHFMFGEQHYEVALELLCNLGVSAERRDWLSRGLPLRTFGSGPAPAEMAPAGSHGTHAHLRAR